MRIKRDAVGAGEAAKGWTVLIGENRRPAVGRIDVHPDVVPAADIGDRIEIVDRAGVGRARGCDNGDPLDVADAIVVQRRLEGVDLHPEVRAGGDSPDRRAAESQQLNRLAHAGMGFR